MDYSRKRANGGGIMKQRAARTTCFCRKSAILILLFPLLLPITESTDADENNLHTNSIEIPSWVFNDKKESMNSADQETGSGKSDGSQVESCTADAGPTMWNGMMEKEKCDDGGARIVVDISHPYSYMHTWQGYSGGFERSPCLLRCRTNGALASVDSLDLAILHGPALVVDVPRYKNITAEDMKYLNLPKGVSRVLFRTPNADKQLLSKQNCDSSYVGFGKDGAEWLVKNTDIKLVGVDYFSVAAFDESTPLQEVSTPSREIILVEALKLDETNPGIYSLHCFPHRFLNMGGSPIQCVLVK